MDIDALLIEVRIEIFRLTRRPGDYPNADIYWLKQKRMNDSFWKRISEIRNT